MNIAVKLRLYRLCFTVLEGLNWTFCGLDADRVRPSAPDRMTGAAASHRGVCRPHRSPEGRFASLRDGPTAHPSPDRCSRTEAGCGKRPDVWTSPAARTRAVAGVCPFGSAAT